MYVGTGARNLFLWALPLIGSPAGPDQRTAPSQKLTPWPCSRPHAPCLPNPLSMTDKASSMSPAVPDRRFGAAAPGDGGSKGGHVAIISGPTGGCRGPRYGTRLKRGPRVRSSWCRSSSFHGLPRPGVARELPFKSHFKGERSFSGANTDSAVI
jgi:hypothetical protein